MKRFLYSNYTKFAAAVIFVICIVAGALTATSGINEIITEEKNLIYNFENDFSESVYLAHYLSEPENVIFNAYHSLYEINVPSDEAVAVIPDETKTETPNNTGLSVITEENNAVVKTKLTPNRETMEKNIEQRLNDLYCKDKINYYIKWNDRVFTNCGATTPEELMQGEFYSYASRAGNGELHIERESSLKHNRYSSSLIEEIARYEETSAITIAANIKDDYVTECRTTWERQEKLINDLITEILFLVVLALLMFIYLICVCGKDKDGELKLMWVDNVWLEVHLAVSGGLGFAALCICLVLLDIVCYGSFPENLMNIAVFFTAAIASSGIITSLLSIIRNIKLKNFIASSIIFRVIRLCWRVFVKVMKWAYRNCKQYKNDLVSLLSKKTGVILISMLLAYTALIGFFGILAPEAPFFFILAILAFGFAAFVVAYRAKDLDEVKKGVNEICSGNSMYKIPELKSEDMKLLATNINEIGKSIDESVAAKLKAERLKTDLITNVSHDLKTPLTSIISYTELLSKVENLPEEAKDYAQIIAQKSDRLKNLTQDLFDISKVQSGNENVVFERLDASLLINQSLAECDSEIQKSDLKFCVDAPKELYISADGRKMSRVISNLINNILKYTMKGTRVFISASEKDNEVIMEFKNIASYPMEFDAEEIMGRFVRGDESRTEEGNGLGLAIARSYTEVCGGKFDIVLDGDMFKAIIRFPKY